VVGDGAVEEQRPDRFDERSQVLVPFHDDVRRDVDLRLRDQPAAHLGDDAEVRLHEDAVRGRPVAVLAQRSGAGRRHGAEPRAQQRAVRQHDLHATLPRLVVAERGEADAVVEGVADDAAPAEVGDRGPQRQPPTADLLEEVEEAHAGLDDGVGELRVELEDAVHPAQVDDDAAAHPRGRPAVAVVPALGDRPQVHARAGGDPDDLLDLLGARGRHDSGRLVLDPGRMRVRVAELPDLQRVGRDVLCPQGCGEAFDGDVEAAASGLRRRAVGPGVHALCLSVGAVPAAGPSA
jgi:hypothetical protein